MLRSEHYSVLGLFLATAGVAAIEPGKLFLVQKGPLVLKPQFNTSATFTDNINYREDDKLSDVLFTVSPGLTLQLGSKDYNHLDFNYFYDRLQYFDHDEFNANQHRFSIGSQFERSRIKIEGSDRIELLSSPLGGGLSLQGQVIDRTTYSDNYRLTYIVTDRTAAYLGLLHSAADYAEGTPLYDSRSLIGTLGFQYRGFTRTFFFGEVYYGQTKSEFNQPVTSQYPTASYVGGFVGARGNFTEKITGTVKGGYEVREYSDDSQGSDSPVVEASVSYRARENTTLGLAYARRQYESVQFFRTTYTSDSVTATVQQEFGADDRLHAELAAAYIASTYEGNAAFARGERADDYLTTGLTITYDIKLWMRVFGGYSFDWLESSEPGIVDYMANRVTLGLQLGY